MSDNMTLIEWIGRYHMGEFDDPAVETQIYAGWYDWFCSDTSLARKTKALAPKVMKVAKSPKLAGKGDKVYVFFKNNCPVYGSLYDDFRICDIETGDVIWTVVPKIGFSDRKGQAELWGKENDFKGPIISGTWEDVLAYFEG